MEPGSLINKFCRLCFCTIIDTNFEPIQEVTDVLSIVIPGVDFEMESGKHVICKTCFTKLFAALSFKSICLDTEDALFPYITSEGKSVIDLKEVYLKEKANIMLSENQKICRLCFQLITSESLSLYKVDVNVMDNYIPQVNINATKNPVICGPCFQSLCEHGSFLQNCRENHEKYVQCCDKPGKHEIKREENDQHSNLNLEEFEIENICHDAQEQFLQVYIKAEETNIKTEGGYKESNPYSNNLHETSTNNENKHVRHSAIITESVHKYEVREVQVNERKPKIQKNDSQLDIPSSDSGYKNKPKSNVKHKELTKHSTEWNLKLHKGVHKKRSENQPYKCDNCDYTAKYKSILQQHQLVHKDISEIPIYRCEVCNFATKSKKYLNQHEIKHKDPSEIKMYKCQMCDYAARFKTNLIEHQIKHKDPSEIQIYKCDKCNFKTKYRRSLRDHLMLHKDPSELEMYRCDVCTYETKHKGCLRVHRRKHSSTIQRYKCDLCSFSTVHKTSMYRHQSPRKCDVCDCESKCMGLFVAHRSVHAKHTKA